jgi:hypothetical protein
MDILYYKIRLAFLLKIKYIFLEMSVFPIATVISLPELADKN